MLATIQLDPPCELILLICLLISIDYFFILTNRKSCQADKVRDLLRTRIKLEQWPSAMRAHNTAYAVLSLTHNGRGPGKKTAMFQELAMPV